MFQFWYGYLAEVEHRGGQCSIGVTFDESVAEVLLASGTATGDDGYRQVVGQLAQSLVGIAVLRAVVVHRREEYLAGTALLCLLRPFEEPALRTLTTALQVAMPAVLVEAGVDGYHTDLRTEPVGDLVDKLRAADGSAVDAYLVCTGIEQPLDVFQLVDAAADGERNVQRLGHSRHHFGKCLATFERGGDVKETELVGSLIRVGFAQLHRVAGTS